MNGLPFTIFVNLHINSIKAWIISKFICYGVDSSGMKNPVPKTMKNRHFII